MANSKQAIKRARQNVKVNALRASQRTKTRTTVKNIIKAVDVKDIEKAKTAFALGCKTLDIMACKRVIHPNKAARLKSRNAKRVKNLVLSQVAAA